MPPFDLFIGIDWSGAKTEVLPNMAVARATPGGGPVDLLPGPHDGKWSRDALFDWLIDLAASGQRVLCGADFSFCFPRVDKDAYFPGLSGVPSTVPGVWAELNAICRDEPHFNVAAFLSHPDYGAHFFSQGTGRDRLRATEQACWDQGFGKPETIFKIVGPKQVAKSSLTGMRVLHALKQRSDRVAVWPFDEVANAGLVMVETYPAAFLRMAGQGGGKVRDLPRLGSALAHFGARAFRGHGSMSDNVADALITAAALRALSDDSGLWNPPGLSDRVRRTEGWTFGIR